jgi:membrane protein
MSKLKIRTLYHIGQHTIQRFLAERTPEAAAGMAYFGLFSLFPLMLVLVAMGSSILDSSQAQEQILNMIMDVFPFSVGIVEENIQKVLQVRGSVKLVGLAGLTWSATGGFSVLTRHINRAWPNADQRSFLKTRLMAYAMLAALVVVMIFLLTANTITQLLPESINGLAGVFTSLRYFSRAVIAVLGFVTLMWLYRWIPNTDVNWSEAIWGSLLATLGTIVVSVGFGWYIGSGLSNYNLVYGSLGAIVALLFWIYLVSIIVLFGAHLSAAIAHFQHLDSIPPQA